MREYSPLLLGGVHMMRLFSLGLGILLLASAHRVTAQAQVTVPPTERPVPASVDAAIDTDDLADGGTGKDAWLQKQADALLEVVGCYLPKSALNTEVAMETRTNHDPKRLIEVRIRLLKTLASHNTKSQCK